MQNLNSSSKLSQWRNMIKKTLFCFSRYWVWLCLCVSSWQTRHCFCSQSCLFVLATHCSITSSSAGRTYAPFALAQQGTCAVLCEIWIMSCCKTSGEGGGSAKMMVGSRKPAEKRIMMKEGDSHTSLGLHCRRHSVATVFWPLWLAWSFERTWVHIATYIWVCVCVWLIPKHLKRFSEDKQTMTLPALTKETIAVNMRITFCSLHVKRCQLQPTHPRLP